MRLNLQRGVTPYVLFHAAGDEPAVVIHARAATSDVMEQAKLDASLVDLAGSMRDELKGAEGDELSAELLQSRGRFGVLLAKAIAKQVIEGWDGVLDEDGTPAPVTEDRIEAFLDLSPVYDAFLETYVSRWMQLQTEKNGSAPQPIGTSEAAPNTAKRARKGAQSAQQP